LPYTQTQLINAVYSEVARSQDAPVDRRRDHDHGAPCGHRRGSRRAPHHGHDHAFRDRRRLFADLVKVVAERVAPFFGRPTDAATLQAAEARLGQSYRLDRTLWTAFERAVLERLDALGADTNAIDGTAVAGLVQEVLDDLAGRRVTTIANEAAISSAQRPHVVTLVAARCLPKAVPAAAVRRRSTRSPPSIGFPRPRASPAPSSSSSRLGAPAPSRSTRARSRARFRTTSTTSPGGM
jgi:hypothetical protein